MIWRPVCVPPGPDIHGVDVPASAENHCWKMRAVCHCRPNCCFLCHLRHCHLHLQPMMNLQAACFAVDRHDPVPGGRDRDRLPMGRVRHWDVADHRIVSSL
jgi:hypothetical protein